LAGVVHVDLYLLAMAGLILWRVVRAPPTHAASETAEEAMPRGRTAALGLAGGFLDAIGGGGWGRRSRARCSAAAARRAR
jgi:uncharacterized protein